jgi:hypothetical protein
MGLFTDPMTLNDGTDSRIFNFRAQNLSEPGSTIGEYIEPAASAAVDSILSVKHSETKGGRKRHLLQRAANISINDADDTLEPLVVNLTVSRSAGHTDAQVQAEINLTLDAATETGFVAGFCRERI